MYKQKYKFNRNKYFVQFQINDLKKYLIEKYIVNTNKMLILMMMDVWLIVQCCNYIIDIEMQYTFCNVI